MLATLTRLRIRQRLRASGFLELARWLDATAPYRASHGVLAEHARPSFGDSASAPQSCSYSSSAAVKANMNYELVSTKLQGMYPCGSADGRSPLIKSGWMGDRPCTCNNTAAPTLNLYCEESPATRVFVQGGE